MKANITNNTPTIQAPDNTVYLSIGMIVKNEERYLDRCLSAVQDLLKKTNGELIIVDTGSTDKTVEIAKRYTDKVYFYEWTNDFAAARNETLKYATGKWYLYIDADEIFETTEGLVKFVLSDQFDHIMHGAYNVRNMTKRTGNSYSDALLFRLHRRYPKMKFEHSIHENISIRPGELGGMIKDVLCIHYGYSDDITKAQMRAKQKRNTILLEECLEKSPDDTHYLLHYVREFKKGESDLKRQLKYIEHGIAVSTSEHMCIVFKSLKILAYLRANEYPKAKEAFDEYFDRDDKIYYSDIDSCYRIAHAANMYKDYETAYKACKRYTIATSFFAEKPTGAEDVSLSPQGCCTDSFITTIKCLTAFCEYRLGINNDIKNLTDKVDFGKTSLLFNQIPGDVLVIYYCRVEHDFTLATKMYRQLLKSDNETLLENYETEIQKCMADEDDKKGIVKSFSTEFSGDESAFTMLFKVLCGKESYKKLLSYSKDEYKRIAPDILYIMIKEGAPYAEVIEMLPKLTDIQNYCITAGLRHEDIFEFIPKYLQSQQPPSTMAELQLYRSICNVALLINLNTVDELKSIFADYCSSMNTELVNTFNPQLCTDENIELLPPKYIFSYLMNQATALQQSGQVIDSIRKMREALSVQEDFARVIGLQLDGIKSEQDEKEKVIAQEKQEFNMLAQTLIQQAEKLIISGKNAEAKIIVDQLSVLLPANIEVKKLKNRL